MTIYNKWMTCNILFRQQDSWVYIDLRQFKTEFEAKKNVQEDLRIKFKKDFEAKKKK